MTNNEAGSPLILDDDEWEKQQEEYDKHVEELSKSLRPCPKHGNPAGIESGYEDELVIMAQDCGCWLGTEYYDSIDDCVAAWNDQPNIDRLEAARAADALRIAELEAKLKEAKHKNVNLQFIIDVNQLSKEAYEPAT